MLYYLSQLDFPAIILIRSFEYPLLDQLGDIGDRLGDGLTLVLISLGIGAAGFFWKSQQLKLLCLHSLLAHGVAGLFAQLIKHSIGRPRPRLMHEHTWEIAPSFESGLDSFPSGHAAASFAVATTLAYYFPKGKILWFGLATFVAICRVTKGSHFPTDVLGGLLVGIASGLVIVYSRSQWNERARRVLVQGLPWLVSGFGLLWIIVPHPGIELEPSLSFFIGLSVFLSGLGLRLWWVRECSSLPVTLSLTPPAWPRLLMGLGLATTTGSTVIIGASILAGMIWWIGSQPSLTNDISANTKGDASLTPLLTEAILGMAMFLLALLTFSLRSHMLSF